MGGALPDLIGAAAIAAMLPHGNPLSLLDAVTAWDERSLQARSRRHLRPAHPLAGRKGLASVQLVEYAAQAAALHLQLREPAAMAPRRGVLALVRELRLRCATIAAVDADLVLQVQQRNAFSGSFLYEFSARLADDVLATGSFGIVLERAPRPMRFAPVC